MTDVGSFVKLLLRNQHVPSMGLHLLKTDPVHINARRDQWQLSAYKVAGDYYLDHHCHAAADIAVFQSH